MWIKQPHFMARIEGVQEWPFYWGMVIRGRFLLITTSFLTTGRRENSIGLMPIAKVRFRVRQGSFRV